MHEDLNRHDEIKVGSERAFGIVFAVVFAVVAAWPLLSGMPPRWWALAVAGAFLAAGYFFPIVLKPLNVLWFKIGMLMYKVVNPLTMAMLYVTTIIPIGLIMRAMGKDPLRLKMDRSASSYWIQRDPPGPEPETMKDQF